MSRSSFWQCHKVHPILTHHDFVTVSKLCDRLCDSRNIDPNISIVIWPICNMIIVIFWLAINHWTSFGGKTIAYYWPIWKMNRAILFLTILCASCLLAEGKSVPKAKGATSREDGTFDCIDSARCKQWIFKPLFILSKIWYTWVLRKLDL